MVESQGSIWVELRFLGRKSFFELHDGGRPLGIGSGWCNDLRIHDPKVALVHCELTRDGDSICVVPTGSADVRLNAAHVGASAVLPSRSVIEFLDHEIQVILHAELPRYYDVGAFEETPPVTLGQCLLGKLRASVTRGNFEET